MMAHQASVEQQRADEIADQNAQIQAANDRRRESRANMSEEARALMDYCNGDLQCQIETQREQERQEQAAANGDFGLTDEEEHKAVANNKTRNEQEWSEDKNANDQYQTVLDMLMPKENW